MNKLYVGLDLGSSQFEQVAMNQEGTITLSRGFKTGEQTLRQAFGDIRGEVHVHLEAGELAGWARTLIAPLVSRVVIGDPRHNAWIAKDPRKNDRLDAFKLADLLRMNRVHEVYYDDSEPRRIFKQVVQHYEDLTQQQARLKVKIKSRLRPHGVIRRDSRLFTQAGREQIFEQVSNPHSREILKQLYTLLDSAQDQQKAALEAMIKMSRQFPEVALLDQAPGVGPICACRFSAYVQNPHRFSNVHKFWHYSRLGVQQQRSDGKPLERAHLDKAGCGALKDVSRKIFEGAMHRHDNNAFKRAYRASLERTKNATHARLSVQRRILATLRAMWMSNSPYRDDCLDEG